MKVILAFLFLSSLTLAEIKWPVLSRPVVDQVGWLSQNELQDLETWLYILKQRGKSQVQVVIVPELQGLPIESYSIQLLDRWKIGDLKRDDGVLFIVSANDRKMRIEVGQGLEGVLTDLHSKRILDDRVRPLFREKNYAAGIVAGVHEILSTIDPDFVAQTQSQMQAPGHVPRPGGSASEEGNSYLFWIILAFFILSSIFGRGRRRSGILPFFLGYGSGRSSGSGWSGGGGGWSGGGGGFSGGGASSDW